jgi:hypothetical protein
MNAARSTTTGTQSPDPSSSTVRPELSATRQLAPADAVPERFGREENGMSDSETAMTFEDAAKFLNNDTTWPPGWSVKARAYPYQTYGTNDIYSHLGVTLTKSGKNSSVVAEDGTYPEPWELQFTLAVPDFALKDKAALMFWVLEKITWCDEHENREFARYRRDDGTWYAPFHPHRGYFSDQSKTPEWQAQYRDPDDIYIAGRK